MVETTALIGFAAPVAGLALFVIGFRHAWWLIRSGVPRHWWLFAASLTVGAILFQTGALMVGSMWVAGRFD